VAQAEADKCSAIAVEKQCQDDVARQEATTLAAPETEVTTEAVAHSNADAAEVVTLADEDTVAEQEVHFDTYYDCSYKLQPTQPS
jgi:hypothetical protein